MFVKLYYSRYVTMCDIKINANYVSNGLVNTLVANFLGISKFVANMKNQFSKLN